ncbi:CAP-Gly domain-containing protein [Cladophialophora immunda]|nr:CAP-Gly domain-containing protein [Cladophialophora immunda]
MADHEVYIGQRRSYGGALCTVRYRGPLSNTKGEWLGIEWDDTSRGKHNGQHEGQQIFQCLSPSPTAASFLRPSRNPDPERALLEAIKFKYAPVNNLRANAASAREVDDMIEISGKVVEEVGFERIQKQLSVLADLKIVLVDELVVSGIARHGSSTQHIRNAQLELERTCPNIVELDLGWNIIETWQDIVDMCVPFRKLKILKAGGLRLRDFEADYSQEPHPFENVEELHLNECLLTSRQIIDILFPKGQCAFPSLKTLSLSLNELDSFEINGTTGVGQCPDLTTLILDNNRFADLSSLPVLLTLFPCLKTLSFQGNTISDLGLDTSGAPRPSSIPNLETLNLANNKIRDYSFVNSLPSLFPNLISLRISRNPLYEPTKSSDESPAPSSGPRHQQQAQSTTSDSTSYYLTLARIPNLKSLNYTTITPRDREEGEIYYLSIAEKELRSLLQRSTGKRPPDQVSETSPRLSPQETVELARKAHPLYSRLCEQYDREDILLRYLQQQSSAKPPSSDLSQDKSDFDAYAPGTLGSRLVDAHFYIPPARASAATPEPFHRFLPTTISVYRLKSLLARHFGLPPLQFRLVYESHEYDPVEPITSTRNPAAGTGDGKNAWEAWGNWDVDGDESVDDGSDGSVSASNGDGDGDGDGEGDGGEQEPGQGNHPRHLSSAAVDHGHLLDDREAQSTTASMPMYITRQGNRFKKRETEILDGMRPWGDFLDLDDGHGHGHGHGQGLQLEGTHADHWSRTRKVEVRVEPHGTVETN